MGRPEFLVAYYSLTGNTRIVAEAIYEALPGEKRLTEVGESLPSGGYDMVFLGFPVMHFGVPRAVKSFIHAIPGGTTVALFVTHAMYEDPGQMIMLNRELEKCRSVIKPENLAGFYHCRGTLSPATAEELRATGIPMLMGFAANQPLTEGHPDAEELESARQFAREVARTLTG